MPGFLVGALSGVASQVILSPVTSYIQSQFAPTDYRNKELAWFGAPIVRPDVSAIFSAYNSGRIDGQSASLMLRYFGVHWIKPDAPFGLASRTAYSIVGNPGWSNLPRTADQIDEDARRIMRMGDDWELIRKSMLTVPGIGTAVDLYTKDFIDDDQFLTMIRDAGGDIRYWEGLTASMFSPVSMSHLFDMRNRGIIDSDAPVINGLARLGHKSQDVRERMARLREVLPSTGEAVHMAVKQLWTRDVESMRQLISEFALETQGWANKTGKFGDSDIPVPGGNAGQKLSWAQAEYAASRHQLAIEQAIEAFRRHRPGRVDRYKIVSPNVTEFTQERLNDTLIATGMVPRDRATIAAMANVAFPLRQLRAAISVKEKIVADPVISTFIPANVLADINTMDRAWIVDNLRDHGFREDDANLEVSVFEAQAAIIANEQKVQFVKAEKKKLVEHALEAFSLGLIKQSDAEAELVSFGLTPLNAAESTDNVKRERAINAAKAAVKGIHHDYISGILDVNGTAAALSQAGINAETVQYYMALWMVEHNHASKTGSASQILKWLEEGLIDRNTAITRLTNLGYSLPETLVNLRHAQIGIDKLTGQKIAAADRSRHQQARQLALVAKAARAQHKEVIHTLRSTLPRASLLSGLKKGILSPQYVQSHLREQEYPDETINLWIRETLYAKPSKESTGQAPQAEAEPVGTQPVAAELGGVQGNVIEPEHSASATTLPATAGTIVS